MWNWSLLSINDLLKMQACLYMHVTCWGEFKGKNVQVCVLSRFSYVWLCAIPQTVAGQAPLSMGFSRREYQSCHFLLQDISLTLGSNPRFLCLLPWQAGSLPTSAIWEAQKSEHPVAFVWFPRGWASPEWRQTEALPDTLSQQRTNAWPFV